MFETAKEVRACATSLRVRIDAMIGYPPTLEQSAQRNIGRSMERHRIILWLLDESTDRHDECDRGGCDGCSLQSAAKSLLEKS